MASIGFEPFERVAYTAAALSAAARLNANARDSNRCAGRPPEASIGRDVMSSETFKRNLGSLTLAQAVNFLYPVLIFPILGNQLGAKTFGVLMSFYAIGVMLTTVVDYGLNFEGPRQVAQIKDDREALASLYVTVTRLRVTIAVLVAAVLLAGWFVKGGKEYRDGKFLLLICMPMMFGAAANAQWLFHGLSRLTGIIYLGAATRATCVAAYLFVAPKEPVAACLALSLPVLLTGLLSQYLLPVQPKWRTRKMDWLAIQHVARQATPVFLASLATVPYTQGGTLLVAYMHGPSAAGLYAAAERLVRPVLSMQAVVFQAAYPSACASKDPASVARAPIAIAYALAAGSSALFLLFPEWLLVNVFSAQFSGAAETLQALCIVLITAPPAMAVAQLWLLAGGNGRATYRAYAYTCVAYCLFAPFLIRSCAHFGAAIALAIAESLATVLLVIAAWRLSHADRP